MAVLLGMVDASQASATGALYAGPSTDQAFAAIAPRLLNALYPEQRLNAVAVTDGTAALDRVAADPTSAALADLATMVAFTATKKLAADRLEFHGPLEQHCLLAFARRDGWVRAFSDIIATNGTPRPTIGLAGAGEPPGPGGLAERSGLAGLGKPAEPGGRAGSAAPSLLDILRRLEPGLEGLDVQQGDADALAAQVAHGAPDLLLLVAYQELDRALIERLADDDRLVVLPVVTRLLSRAAFDRDSGFTMQPVRTDLGLAPWSRPKPITLCTPVGVVLRGDAPPALRDAVNRAVPAVASTLRTSLTDRASAAASSTLHDALDAVQGLISRLRSN